MQRSVSDIHTIVLAAHRILIRYSSGAEYRAWKKILTEMEGDCLEARIDAERERKEKELCSINAGFITKYNSSASHQPQIRRPRPS